MENVGWQIEVALAQLDKPTHQELAELSFSHEPQSTAKPSVFCLKRQKPLSSIPKPRLCQAMPAPAYRPQLNRRSVTLDRLLRAASCSTRWDSLYQLHAAKSSKPVAKPDENDAECTFRPQIRGTTAQSGPTAERLHRWLAVKQQKLGEIRSKESSKELTECTFSPLINKDFKRGTSAGQLRRPLSEPRLERVQSRDLTSGQFEQARQALHREILLL